MDAYLVFFIIYIIIPGNTTQYTVSSEPEGGGLNHCFDKIHGNNPGAWCDGDVKLSCFNQTGRLSDVFNAFLVKCRRSACSSCCSTSTTVSTVEIDIQCGNGDHSECSISPPHYNYPGCFCDIQYNCTYLESTTTQSTSASISTENSANIQSTLTSTSPSASTSSGVRANATTTTSYIGTMATTTANVSLDSTTSVSTKATMTTADNSSFPVDAIVSEKGSDTTPVAAIVVPIILVLVILAAVLATFCLRHKYTCCTYRKPDHGSTAAISNAAYIDHSDDRIVIAKHSQFDCTGYTEIGPRVTSITCHANTDSLQPPLVPSSDYDVMNAGTRPISPDPTYNHLATHTYSHVTRKHADLTYDHIGGMGTTKTGESVDENTYNTVRLEGLAMDSSKPDKVYKGENVYNHAVNDQEDRSPDTETVNNDISEEDNDEKRIKHDYFVLEKLQGDP